MSISISRSKSFTTVFLIEMWERFGYYGMAALLVLFMVNRLGFTDSHAYLTWGAFAALVYSSPAVGGWIGDRLLGTRRTMLCGAFVLMAGYLTLCLPENNLNYMYASLGVIVVGNGMFKSNAANLVRRIFEGDEARLDSAFTVYYMAVNIGATGSMLATPWIKDHWGWHTAFAVCAVGMILALLHYRLMAATVAHLGSDLDTKPVQWKRAGAVAIGAVALVAASVFALQHKAVAQICVYSCAAVVLTIFVYLLNRCKKSERSGLVTALLLIFQTVLFFIFYQQLSTSLTMFALRNVDPHFALFGHTLFTFSAAQFMSLNPVWIMLLSPVLALLYGKLASTGKDASIPGKFALGFVAVSAAFFLLAISGRFAAAGIVSPWFMVGGYGLYSLGELLVSGLGLAMIARYVPTRMGGFMMGAYLLSTGVAQYLGSVVANYAQVPAGNIDAPHSLSIYTRFFADLGWAAAAGALVAGLMLPLFSRLSRRHFTAQDGARATGYAAQI